MLVIVFILTLILKVTVHCTLALKVIHPNCSKRLETSLHQILIPVTHTLKVILPFCSKRLEASPHLRFTHTFKVIHPNCSRRLEISPHQIFWTTPVALTLKVIHPYCSRRLDTFLFLLLVILKANWMEMTLSPYLLIHLPHLRKH